MSDATSPHPYYDTPLCKLLREKLATSPRSVDEIAREMGYENGKIITAFANGVTQVPMTRALPLVDALGISARTFIDLGVESYGHAWQAVIDIHERLRMDEKQTMH